jgi:hypothetical protein
MEGFVLSELKAKADSPCRRPPLLLGRHVLAGVGVGVPRVLVGWSEEDLALVPPSEDPALPFSLELLSPVGISSERQMTHFMSSLHAEL